MATSVRNSKGASLTSYGLLVGLIGIVGLAAVTNIGSEVSSLFGTVEADMEAVINNQPLVVQSATPSATPTPSLAPTVIDLGQIPSNITAANITNGGLTVQFGGSPSSGGAVLSEFAASSGKYYWEATTHSTAWATGFGVVSGASLNPNSFYVGASTYVLAYSNNAQLLTDSGSSNNAFSPTFGNGSTVGVALDADAGKVWFCISGNWVGGASLADVGAGLNPTKDGLPGNLRATLNDGGSPSPYASFNFGQSAFSAPCGIPTGFTEGFGPIS